MILLRGGLGAVYCFMGGNSVKMYLPPSEKKFTLKGKNLLPLGAKSFLFRVDSFSECA